MKPIVTAGDDDFLAARRGRHRRRFGKTFQLVRLENAVGDFIFSGKFFARRIGRGFAVRPDVGAQIFRQPVKTDRAIGFNHAADIADGVQKINPLRQRKFRRAGLEFLQRGIRPEQHGKFTELRRLFQENAGRAT